MDEAEPTTTGAGESGALRLTMEVWHPGCWVLETTATVDAGLLAYGLFTRGDGHATTLFTCYADETARLDRAVEVARGHDAVFDVAEMARDHRRTTPRPGNVARELLVDHDGTTQIADAFTTRGFVLADPVDTRDGVEYWTLLTHHDRDRVDEALDEVRRAKGADITVTGVTRADGTRDSGPLPLDRLSARQREVFRLARDHGYYDRPRRTDAPALAAELGVTTSTLHEHLRKIEARLLGSR